MCVRVVYMWVSDRLGGGKIELIRTFGGFSILKNFRRFSKYFREFRCRRSIPNDIKLHDLRL